MKKLFYLTVMLAAMLWSCDKDKDDDELDVENGEGVITMVAETDEIEELRIESFKEGETITIDWGDGTKEKFETVAAYDEKNGKIYGYMPDDLEHSYSNDNPHKITIKGNIKKLYCSGNRLTSLDVSRCTELTFLDCSYNHLISLDVSKNTTLNWLECSYNDDLTSLDVRGCTELTHLGCFDNNLTSLDVSKCTALTYLNCYDNNLTSLDVSKNTALTYLDCFANNLTSLDVSKNTALNWLHCTENSLTSLNVRGCTELTYLGCSDNNLSATVLNRIFNDLPMGSEYSHIGISNNPGSKTCDTNIAENKGWRVY